METFKYGGKCFRTSGVEIGALSHQGGLWARVPLCYFLNRASLAVKDDVLYKQGAQ